MPKIVPIPASRLGKIFEKDGFKCVRIEGDHYVYTKQGVMRPIVIPNLIGRQCQYLLSETT